MVIDVKTAKGETLTLTDKEVNLLKTIRSEVLDGRLEIVIHQGQPVRILRGVKGREL